MSDEITINKESKTGLYFEFYYEKWLSPEEISDFESGKAVTKNRMEKELNTLIKKHFLTFKQAYLNYSLLELVSLLQEENGYKITEPMKLKDYLATQPNIILSTVLTNYEVHTLVKQTITIEHPEPYRIKTTTKNDYPYKFHYSDWLTPDEANSK